MAYTTPATATAGNILTAAYLNTYVRDNVAWLATDSPSCRVYNNAAFSVPNAAFTAVTFNSERFDNAAIHSTVTNTERLTIPTGGGGKYVVGGGAAYTANGNGNTRILSVGVNGIATYAGAQSSPWNAAANTYINISTVYTMAAADYFTMPAYQDSTAALNIVQANNYSPEFFCFWFRT